MMSALLLLRAELLKLRRSQVFLVVLAVMGVLSVAVPSYCALMLGLAGSDTCATDMVVWPNSLEAALSFYDGLSFPVVLLLYSWFVGAEFSRDTWKMSLPRRSWRWPFLVAKALVCGLGVLLICGLWVVGWVGVAALSSPLIGLEAAQQTSSTASVNVLERMAGALPEAESELYQWSETDGGLRIASQAPPLPEPASSEVETGVGIRARVPLVVAADASGTLPRASGAPPAARPGASARERGVRLAAVMQAAAAVEAFHPYHSRTVPDLDASIAAALRAAAEQPGATAGLDRLASDLRDGHAQVIHPDAARLRALPWEWRPVGEDLVITAVSPTGAGGVRPGDRVVRFGGESIEAAWDRWEEVATGGSPGCRRLEGVRWAGALLGEPGRSVEVEVESLDGARRTVEVSYDTAPGSLRSIRLDPVAELSEGTLYVDLSRLDDRMWRDSLKRLTAAERLVVDLRDYPGGLSRDFLRHFSTETLVSDDFVLPIWGAAGEEVRSLSTAWRLTPKEPHISAERVFLADAGSVSYAESILGVVQRASLGPIVGDTSCGSNGNLTRTHLIGGTLWGFTGLDTLGPDTPGPDTPGPDGIHRNPAGIQPDRRVRPTREGVAESRDEVLEAALAVLADGD